DWRGGGCGSRHDADGGGVGRRGGDGGPAVHGDLLRVEVELRAGSVPRLSDAQPVRPRVWKTPGRLQKAIPLSPPTAWAGSPAPCCLGFTADTSTGARRRSTARGGETCRRCRRKPAR